MFKIDVVQIFDLVQLSSGYNFAVLPLVQWGDVSAEMVDTIVSVNSKKQLHHRPDVHEDAFKTGKPPDNGKMFETK